MTRRRSSGARPGKPAAAAPGEDSNGTIGEYCSGTDTDRYNHCRSGLMAKNTYVRTIGFVAEVLEEDLELLQAIVSNDDNLSYGSIITVYTGNDESITALTEDGMAELEQMLSDARRSPQKWNDFLDSFVDDEQLVARIKAKSLR